MSQSVIITRDPQGTVTVTLDVAAILGLANVQPSSLDTFHALAEQATAANVAEQAANDAALSDAAAMVAAAKAQAEQAAPTIGQPVRAERRGANTWHTLDVDGQTVGRYRTKTAANTAILDAAKVAASAPAPAAPAAPAKPAKPAKVKQTAAEREAAKAAKAQRSALNKAAYAVLGGHKAAGRWADALALATERGWAGEVAAITNRMAADLS